MAALSLADMLAESAGLACCVTLQRLDLADNSLSCVSDLASLSRLT